jgi:hypothetical protein
MKTTIRLAVAGALLATAAFASAPVAASPTGETIKITCSNGFTRTVSARAARGVTTSLNKFNQYRGSGVTCWSEPGAPRVKAKSHLTVACTNGFERRVNARAANGIARALTKFNAYNRRGITCQVVPPV